MPKENKIPVLRKALSQLGIAQFFIRLLWEIKGIDNAQFIKLSDPLNAIGKMLGGWIRGLESKTPARSAGETQ